MSRESVMRRRYLSGLQTLLYKPFLYVLNRSHTNLVEWGFGYHTFDMLQLMHRTVYAEPVGVVQQEISNVKRGPVYFNTDRHAAVFQNDDVRLLDDDREWLAEMLSEVRAAAWLLHYGEHCQIS
jgi:hypothetical protein